MLVYDYDSLNDVLERIAIEKKTLPKFLYIKIGGNHYQKKDLDLETLKNEEPKTYDLLKFIQENASKSENFSKFYEKFNKKFPNSGLDVKEDLLQLWLSYNTGLENLAEFGADVLEEQADILLKEGYISNFAEFLNLWNKRKRLINDIENQIKSARISSEKSGNKILNEIKEEAISTPSIVERTMNKLFLDIKNLSLLELFNSLVLNHSAPFAKCKEYYKIFTEFLPPEEWLSEKKIEEKEFLSLKINQKLTSSEYIDANLIFEPILSTKNKEQAIVEVKIFNDPEYISLSEFIQRYTNTFYNIGISVSKTEEVEVTGIFYYPQNQIDLYVFADLVLNNELFSTFITIDESQKATKRKSEESDLQKWAYIRFMNSNTGLITASISQKNVDRSEPFMKEQDTDIFPHGSPYIRIRATGKDFASIEKFREMFSKLLTVYDREYNSIVSEYRKFIPNFAKVKKVEVKERRDRLETQLPSVFTKNYSRKCGESRIPKIVSEEEGKEYEKKGRQVISFPRESPKKGMKYPSDGSDPHVYVCPQDEYPFPGLQNNKLENSEQYPFLPCCFKTDQSDKPGNYRKYYFGEAEVEREKKQQDFIITDKMAGYGKYGDLPDELEQIFNLLDTQGGYKYMRVGVDRNPDSFLSCILFVLGKLKGNEKERGTILRKERNKLAELEVCILAKQNLYNNSVDMISSELKSDSYLNPRMYIQLLETYYGINIILFNSSEIFLPYYTQGYYKLKNNYPTLFIFEHWGSESDHAKYPQCEVIAKWNTKRSDDIFYLFDENNKILRVMGSVNEKIETSYNLDRKVRNVEYNFGEVISQGVDSYGKTRLVNVMYEGREISLIISPIPPLAVKEGEMKDSTGFENAHKFLNEYGRIVSQSVDEKGRITQLHGKIGTVNVTILVDGGNVIEDLMIVPEMKLYEEVGEKEVGSELLRYNRNQRMARYLFEYTVWLFSLFLKEGKIENITDRVLSKFAKSSFVIKNGFEYKGVDKIFSLNSGILENGKLIVQNEEMIKRLMYMLKLYTIRDLPSVLNYYELESIKNYYVDITDFDVRERQIILEGTDTVLDWIKESKFVYRIHSAVVPGQKSPYFFRNKLIDNKIYLAQNAYTLETALIIGYDWEKENYNVGIYPERKEVNDIDFELYTYGNEYNIKKYFVRNEKESEKYYNIKIVGYKIDGISYFTVLMRL